VLPLPLHQCQISELAIICYIYSQHLAAPMGRRIYQGQAGGGG